MIIGIDGNEANVAEKVGVSVYTHAILTHFAKEASENVQFIVYLRHPPSGHPTSVSLPKPNDFFTYEIIPGPFLWSQVFLPFHLYTKKRPDVFFSPAHYTPRFCPVPVVTTIHDLSYFYYPDEFLKQDLYKLKNWTARSIEKSKKLIAVSKNTKKDILKFYPHIREQKITVIYNGFENNIVGDGSSVPNKGEITSPLRKYNLKPNAYLLYVGTLQPRKNITTLIDAFKLLTKTDPEMKLVIVGKKGWMYEEIFQMVTDLGLTNRVVFTGYLPDEEVAVLYENAFCYILPSFYEGFGIPILEAMSHGCPVITSFNSSLPEIGGEACEYFDPTSAQNLVEKIHEIKNNPTHRKDLIKKGKERVKEFSWEKCAIETLKLLKSSALKTSA